MSRSQIALLIIALAILCMGCIFIGKAIGDTRTIIVTKLPETLVCQSFRTEEDDKAQQKELKNMGAKPVMDQMLVHAFKAHSEGKGELIRVAERVCKEHLGSIQSTRATTYYFSPGVKK